MNQVSRRSVATGLADAVTAIPAAGLRIGLKNNARARIEHHAREMEKAMCELYGVEVETINWIGRPGAKPMVLVVAHVGGRWSA